MFVNSLVWCRLAILYGYNLEIRHILRKKNPANLLSHQLVADVLVKESSIKGADAEYVQKLRVHKSVTDQEIQEALHLLCIVSGSR